MQEQMNSMNDSGEFQEVGDCLTFPVDQQWFQVLVPCRASTNACHLIHGTHLNYRETLLATNFIHLIRPEILLKKFLIVRHRERQDQFHKRQGQGPLSPEMKNKIGHTSNADICKKAVDHEFINTGGSSAEFYAKTANIGAAIRQVPYTFFIPMLGRPDSRTNWPLVLIFRRKLCYGSKKWRWSIHWMNENSHDRWLARIFQILKGWTRRLLLLWIRSSKIPTSRRKSVSRNRKPRKRMSFYEEDIAFMIYDYFRVTGARDTELDYADLFSVTLHDDMFRNSIQDGMKVYYLCQRFRPMISWRVCPNWEYVSLSTSKLY